MKSPYQLLKETSAQQFEYFRKLLRPDLGSHKRTRLIQAGCANSGSLLHNEVAEQHAKMLRADFESAFGSSSQSDLFFLTILDSVTSLDPNLIEKAVREMEDRIQVSLGGIGVTCIGAVEIEIVSLSLLRRISKESDNEVRKLAVLESLCNPDNGQLDTGVLIHFHGVLDMGNSTLQAQGLRSRLSTWLDWSRAPYQVELKGFFKDRPVSASLDYIARYLTKGGNDTLRYNPGFGRDVNDQLDSQLWRTGLGRIDRGGDRMTDERSLDYNEINQLDRSLTALMRQTADNRGYLIKLVPDS